MIIRTKRITFASDSNHNELKNNTNDFPKLDNFLNAQLYLLSKNLVVKRNVLAKLTIFFNNCKFPLTVGLHFKLSSKGLNK